MTTKSKKWTVWVLCSAPWRPDVWVYNKEYINAQEKVRDEYYELCKDCAVSQDECNFDAPTYPICYQHINAFSSTKHKISSEPEIEKTIKLRKKEPKLNFRGQIIYPTAKIRVSNDFVSSCRKNWDSKHRC